MVKDFIIRPAVDGDRNFIFSTWLRSFRYHGELVRHVPNDIYYKYHQQVIERIMARGAQALVIADKNDINTVFGYVITEGSTVVHFAYVKKAFRRMGFLRAALDNKTEWTFTHWTAVCNQLTYKYPNLQYNPYFI